MTFNDIFCYMAIAIFMITLGASVAVVPLAIFDTTEKLGDEMRDYFEGEDE